MGNIIKKIQAGTITYDIEPANAAELDVTNKASTLAWNTTSTIATVNGTDITVKMPANPDTKVTVDSALSSTSTNPVQNKVINSALAGKASTAAASTTTAGLMSKDDKIKLNGIAAGAEVNVQSDWNATSGDAFIKNKPTILTIGTGASNAAAGNHTHNYASTAVATTTTAGLMSKDDKVKLDGIASGANKITVDSALSSTSTNPVQNKVINSALAGKASTAVATTTTAGLMSKDDKVKLNGITTGANKVTKAKATGNTTTVASNAHTHSVTATGSVSLSHTSTNSSNVSAHSHSLNGITSGYSIMIGSYTNGVLTLNTANITLTTAGGHSHTYDKATSASFTGSSANTGTPSATATVPTSGHTHGLE